jgi:hypothetical protein
MHALTRTTTALALVGLATLGLAACTPTTPTTPTDDSDSAGSETTGSETTTPSAAESCLTGTWELNVPNFAEQSATYLADLNIPIVGFAMEGSQTLIFTPTHIVELDTDITSTGTIKVRDFTGPISQHTTSVSTGDWSIADDGSLNLEHWTMTEGTVPSSPDIPEDSGVGGVDYANIPVVDIICDGDSLFLQAPGAPLGSYWTRRS